MPDPTSPPPGATQTPDPAATNRRPPLGTFYSDPRYSAPYDARDWGGNGFNYQDPGFFGNNPYRADPGAFQSRALDIDKQDLQSRLSDLQKRPQIQFDMSQQDQFRGQQMALANALQAQANGTGGPSVAQQQLNQATDRNLAQAYAMSAAQPNNGAQARNVAYQRGAISQQANADGAQLRAQEQMAARNQLGQVLAGARGQDIGAATENANVQQQQQAQLDQMTRYYLSSGMSLDQAQMQAQMAYQQLQAQSFAAAANHSIGGTITGGAMQAGGGLIAALAM